jgi:hypothetical protein
MGSLRIKLVLVAILSIAFLPGCRSQSNNAAGHELLDAYLSNQMSVSNGKEGAAARMEESLSAMESKAKSHKAELPEQFFDRYMRLIAATRLVIKTPQTSETKQGLHDYIRSVTGSAPPPGQNLTVLAAFAFSTEVVKLGMLLDGETNFERAKKKQIDRVLPKR